MSYVYGKPERFGHGDGMKGLRTGDASGRSIERKAPRSTVSEVL